MKAFVLILALVAAAGCSSTQSSAREATPEGFVLLSDVEDPPSSKSDREYSNIRSAWSVHLEDCRTGLDFTLRSFSRNIERDRQRLRWIFE